MKKLEGRRAVVTGSTSGIGEAIVKTLAAEGASVIVTGRNEDKGYTICNEIQKDGGTSEFIKCDVSIEAEVEKLVEDAVDKLGGIDILVNNAGIMLKSAEIERISAEDWEMTFATNISSMFYVTRLMKPYLLESKGCIINNASIAGLQYYVAGRSYAYSASKAAVIQFTRQMAQNYGEEGIRVNCICPGIIDTPILGDRDRAVYAKRVPLGYVGKPEDVAKVVAFLASDDASYLTGVVLPIDGGVSL